MKNLFIITGTSRGIGEAIARSLADGDNQVVGIARSRNEDLEKHFSGKQADFQFWPVDLSDVGKLEAHIENKFHETLTGTYESVTLINNAGMLEPVDKIIRTHSSDVISHINVNLTAVMIITASFLRYFEKQAISKEVVSISSGAAYNAYTGWGSYCASKAGSLMFSKVLAEEQKLQQHPAKVVSLAPGVVETDMQRTIRSKKEEQFPNLSKFIELKEKGILYSTDKVGETIASTILHNPEIENGAEIDLRTFQDG